MSTCATSSVTDCSALGGRFGLGAETWYRQSSATTDARSETHCERSSGAAIAASRVGDAERERERELRPVCELRRRRRRGLSKWPCALSAPALAGVSSANVYSIDGQKTSRLTPHGRYTSPRRSNRENISQLDHQGVMSVQSAASSPSSPSCSSAPSPLVSFFLPHQPAR